MDTSKTRRQLLRSTALGAGVLGFQPDPALARADLAVPRRTEETIKVVVWDEQQPAQKEAYGNFLGNAIAEYLRAQPALSVTSVTLNDPEQGLSDAVIKDAQVLIWWGHARQAEVAPETGKRLVERIKAGTLALIALHSAHWSTPFVEAMNERSRIDAARSFGTDNPGALLIREVAPPQRYTVPKPETRLTPYVSARRYPDGTSTATVHLPYCCFPAYRNDGKPSLVRVLRPEHPIVAGVPRQFELPHTEMYDEPFHVPEPDLVILEERWSTGEWFRSGLIWKLGAGRVFYFRPGHETFPIYKQRLPLKILDNATRWLAREHAPRGT